MAEAVRAIRIQVAHCTASHPMPTTASARHPPDPGRVASYPEWPKAARRPHQHISMTAFATRHILPLVPPALPLISPSWTMTDDDQGRFLPGRYVRAPMFNGLVTTQHIYLDVFVLEPVSHSVVVWTR
ncbi:hypothetical protein VDGL01_07678 [Verticillium dahliae]